MNKDDAFLKDVQVDDKVKVTVNFLLGQKLSFEGTCIRKTDDKLSILTSTNPEPVDLPLSEITEGIITSKHTVSVTKPVNDNTYENIEIKRPDVIYGYYIVDLKNEKRSGNFAKLSEDVDKNDVAAVTWLLLREYFTNFIIENLYNSDLKKIEPFFYYRERNKDRGKDIDVLYEEYLTSFDTFINKGKIYDNIGYSNLKTYLSDIVYLYNFINYLPDKDKEYQSFYKDMQLDTIFYLYHIIFIYCINISKQNGKLNKEIFNTLYEYLFKYHFILELFFDTSFSELEKQFYEIPNTNFHLKLIMLLLREGLDDFKNNNNKELENWYNEQVNKHNLFNSDLKPSDTEIDYDKPVLVPLVSATLLQQSPKYTLINFLYTLYVSETGLLYIKVANNELHKSLIHYLKTKHNLDNDLDSSIKTVFCHFTKIIDIFFLNIIKICNTLSNIYFWNKDLYNIININAETVIESLEHEADKYITITTKYNNNLKLFFKRLATITSPTDKLNFSKAEEQLLLSKQHCSELIKESKEEIFSGSIQFYLELANKASHSEKITKYFYSKFVTEINVSVIRNAISINPELNRIFIPLEITSSKNGQTSIILKICLQSSLANKAYEDILSNVKLIPDGHLFYLAEIPYADLDSVQCGFDIDVTLEYKFKTSWDFEKCEATWETREVSESFFLQDEFMHLSDFHKIRNLFRGFSSGGVITDERMFFGREQDIKGVVDEIRDESGRIIPNRCICIYGQTRTGKSSLLYHIGQGLRASSSNIVVDIGDIGVTGGSDAGIKYRILNGLLQEIELEHENICAILTDSGISMSADFERIKDEDNYFLEQIDKIRSIIKRKARGTQIIILIDEFTYVYDWIKLGKLSVDFMKFWRGFISNYDICAIIIGQDHMMKFIDDQRFTNAFGAISTREVNYLKEPDARKLVTVPVSDSPDYAGKEGCVIQPEAVNLLVEITCGSAYLLMNLCADFIDYLNERHAQTATGGHAEDFIRKNFSRFEERWFEPLFNDKSDLDSDASITANKELLKKLALSYSEHSGVLLDELAITDEEKERLHSLESRKVVEIEDGRCRIKVRLYAEWLRNKFGSK